ncbi:hypothetical protein GN958_ATG22199 [Phytophthora infestans]|uniref:Uncharacterized protein n=1 Tax=Phytophthora infestans TaxID=4787 RepID=A0A8S9TJP3_PHYIN|nr:hypothetical protein GN958_ATG22199 [Phytophthora infestans]KAI9994449.1 hypothetical protein PInf_011079 [Phytophthora infestans]
MATLGKRNREDDALAKITPYLMYSWVKEEYVAAIRNEKFFATVRDKFDFTDVYEVNDESEDDGPLSEEDQKAQALDWKFYFAGGSCRYMFQYTTKWLKDTVDEAIASVLNKADLVKYCSGNYHHETIHKLYGMHRYDLDGRVRHGRVPVSSYVASRFAAECSEHAIMELVADYNTSRNISLKGYIPKWLFLASLATRKVKLFGSANDVNVLPQANVLPFDPEKPLKRLDKKGIRQLGTISRRNSDDTYDIHFGAGWQETYVSAGHIVPMGESYGGSLCKFEVGDIVRTQPSPKLKADQKWLQPVSWDQGGYDAVHFDSETGEVIFIQVIRSDQHDVKMRYFDEVLQKLKESGMGPEFTVMVFFVVKLDKWLEF